MSGTGPVHGTSSLTYRAKDIIPLGEEYVKCRIGKNILHVRFFYMSDRFSTTSSHLE